MYIIQNRRHFLAGAAAAGAVGLIGSTREARCETRPETSSVRLPSPKGYPSVNGSPT